MEADVREVKGGRLKSKLQFHSTETVAGGKLARCVANVSQSTEYYPPTVPRLGAVRTRLAFLSLFFFFFETSNARHGSQHDTLPA